MRPGAALGTEQILSRIRRMESDEEPSSGTDAWNTLEALHNNTTHTTLIIIRLSGNGTKTHDMRIFSCSVKTLLILSPHLRCRIESSCYVGNVSCRNNVICNLKYHHILLFQSLLCSQFWPRFIQNNGI